MMDSTQFVLLKYILLYLGQVLNLIVTPGSRGVHEYVDVVNVYEVVSLLLPLSWCNISIVLFDIFLISLVKKEGGLLLDVDYAVVDVDSAVLRDVALATKLCLAELC